MTIEDVDNQIKNKKEELSKLRESFYLTTRSLEEELHNLVKEKKNLINTDIDIIGKVCKIPNGHIGEIKEFRISRKNSNIICQVLIDVPVDHYDYEYPEYRTKEFDLKSLIIS